MDDVAGPKKLMSDDHCHFFFVLICLRMALLCIGCNHADDSGVMVVIFAPSPSKKRPLIQLLGFPLGLEIWQQRSGSNVNCHQEMQQLMLPLLPHNNISGPMGSPTDQMAGSVGWVQLTGSRSSTTAFFCSRLSLKCIFW